MGVQQSMAGNLKSNLRAAGELPTVIHARYLGAN